MLFDPSQDRAARSIQERKTVRAMIPMLGCSALRNHRTAADFTGKMVLAGMAEIEAFRVEFPFIFSIHVIFLLKVVVCN